MKTTHEKSQALRPEKACITAAHQPACAAGRDSEAAASEVATPEGVSTEPVSVAKPVSESTTPEPLPGCPEPETCTPQSETAPESIEATPASGAQPSPQVELLDLNRIVTGSYNPRKDFREDTLLELSESIRQSGVLQPICVRPHEDGFEIVSVSDRNYIQFFVGDTRVVDTLGDNRRQLDKITDLMSRIVGQEEFYVDTITLTATASPEGSYAANERLARGRAEALKQYLARSYGRHIDTLLTVRWIAEDWDELVRLIKGTKELPHRGKILESIAAEKNPDRREVKLQQHFPAQYRYIREKLYPQLRAVNVRYDLRRVGMVKDTIHTTELDTTYARGVELLQKRKYAKALYILNDYGDRNTVVAHLSLGHDERALELLATLPDDAVTEYLRAIACSRLGRKAESREHFLEACRLDERMEYRGNLDPEIAELLKDGQP